MGLKPHPDNDNDLYRFVERYLVFVGCADPECEHAGNHPQGWDACAFGHNDLNVIRQEILTIPGNFWWHVLDLGQNPPRVIMRSTDAGAPHH